MLIILPSPIPELQHALLPQSALSQGTCPDSLLFRCFHFKLTFDFIKELGSPSISIYTWFFFLEELMTWKNTFLCFCLIRMLLDACAFVGIAKTLVKRGHFHCLVIVLCFQTNWWTTLDLYLNYFHLHFEHLAFPVTTYNIHFHYVFLMMVICKFHLLQQSHPWYAKEYSWPSPLERLQ